LVGAEGPDGAAGAGGGVVEDDAGAGVSRIDLVGPEVPRFIRARVNDRPMKITARIAVVRVSRLAVPRPDMNEPMPWELPIPSPPPSERWIRTTPIRARVTNKWMISSTVLNAWDFQWDLAAVQGSYALTNRRARLLPGLSGAGNR
jgi:hypothetical protein